MTRLHKTLLRLGERLGDRLRLLERDDPDHPIAMYRWLWRALEQSSRSRLWLRLRFAALLVQDVVLLLSWAVMRPFRSPRVASLFLTAAALAVALVWSQPAPVSMDGEEVWAEVAEPDRQIDHARIAVEADGLVRFEGQRMTVAELRKVVRYFAVRSASVSVDTTATAGAVSTLAVVLGQEGIESVGPAHLNRRRVLPQQ